MYKTVSFKKKLLATLVASSSLGLSGFAFAQDDAEEIVVTGIKASMARAMDIKQDSVGVVDAITAEDMGKFPDTNLAESLQRITGVSISRSNGEGSQVTIRGFGADYNLITLNGRAMPGATANRTGGGTPSSRSFDFANIASESIAAVEVYKTGRADISSGGIGGTINIKTPHPLDNNGFKASVGGKLVSDSTNINGDDVTPELSGIVSWSDETFGVALTASHQKRDSANIGAFVSNWNDTAIWHTADTTHAYLPNTPASAIKNAPSEGQSYSVPTDIRYQITDVTQTRDNAQLTLQYSPVENVVGTLDYTYARRTDHTQRGEQSIWFQGGSYDAVTFDSGAVKTATFVAQNGAGGGGGHGLAVQDGQMKDELKSTGANIKWDVNDALTLSVDGHHSEAVSGPDTPEGYNWVNVGITAPVMGGYQATFNDSLPIQSFTFKERATGPNVNGKYDADDISSQIMQMFSAQQKVTINQFKVDGDLSLDKNTINFGLESRNTEQNASNGFTQTTMGDWGITNPGDVPNELVRAINFPSAFEDYNTKGATTTAFTGNGRAIGQWAIKQYANQPGGGKAHFTADPVNNETIEENIRSIYVQWNREGEVAGMKTHAALGLRYEATDVMSSALTRLPLSLTWESNNDFHYNRQASQTSFSQKATYSHTLPNLDFDIQLTEGVKGRVSFNETIGRPTYNNLSSAVTLNNPSGATIPSIPGQRVTASAGDPSILPLKSQNFDASIEWYYADASYVSIGVFEKHVENFVGTQQINKNWFGLQDPTQGASVTAARAALAAMGLDGSDDTRLFTMTALIEAGKQGTYQDNQAFWDAAEPLYDVNSKADSPLLIYRTTVPFNDKSAKIHGAEFAVQHFFGETGFGVSANYTKVSGDIGYDVLLDPTQNQFALTGLSDTANASLIYENYGFTSRISYNWRDEFLAAAGQTPTFVEAFSQIDFNISYAVPQFEGLSVSLEGINVTGENFRSHARTKNQLVGLQDLGARYNLGVRYNF
ncbi:TonB-dependent receptor [Cellvibrio zantedeschiae]|uniref:TonB-dependent receptor n=1 Tax=Cellvibrio zantedeschiae TaxID=1237077 RepID=A0ABQ3AZU0_9GAMM|nr:TonB-dependent receptor [Cellvibrio zantedeschiae]GGY71635.1 TonB-dependent receptor [Cellvibrio zantedeschiae]